MNKSSWLPLVSFMVVILFVSGCVEKSALEPGKQQLKNTARQMPGTLAILPFDNNSVTGRNDYEPLTAGLSAMLITDLTNCQTRLKIIERGKIRDLLKEIALGQSGSIDQATAVRAGKILGAQAIAFGAFMVLSEQVRIDARIINVETSETILAESISGRSGEFLDLEKKLALKIADSLNVTMTPAKSTAATAGDLDAALYFSRGLEALDRGDVEESQQMFDKSIKLNPDFREQVENVQRYGKR